MMAVEIMELTVPGLTAHLALRLIPNQLGLPALVPLAVPAILASNIRSSPVNGP
jgi:hypothetical protein